MAEKWILAPPGKWGKMAEKWEKWPKMGSVQGNKDPQSFTLVSRENSTKKENRKVSARVLSPRFRGMLISTNDHGSLHIRTVPQLTIINGGGWYGPVGNNFQTRSTDVSAIYLGCVLATASQCWIRVRQEPLLLQCAVSAHDRILYVKHPWLDALLASPDKKKGPPKLVIGSNGSQTTQPKTAQSIPTKAINANFGIWCSLWNLNTSNTQRKEVDPVCAVLGFLVLGAATAYWIVFKVIEIGLRVCNLMCKLSVSELWNDNLPF